MEKEKNKLKFEGEYLYCFRLNVSEYNKGRLEYEGEYFFFKNGMVLDMMKIKVLYIN